ncbi:MAG TPA: hypothetical protein VII01_07220 [Solirubrobacteraceae bacterium]
MNTIRERDALTVFREGTYLSRATHDRRALLAAGDALAEAAFRIGGSSRTEGGRCVFCGKSDPGKFHDDGCPFEIARAALAEWEATIG